MAKSPHVKDEASKAPFKFFTLGKSISVKASAQITTGACIDLKRNDCIDGTNPKGYKINAVPGGLEGS
jgi:hypothetical protein